MARPEAQKAVQGRSMHYVGGILELGVIVLGLEIRQEIVYHIHIVHKQKNTVQSGVSLLHVNYSTTIRDEEEVS